MKRLIVCCDGTWQDLEASYPTNVVKTIHFITNVAKDGISQVVFYDEGIGTGGSTELTKRLDRISGGALGKGIDKNIQDAYRFLCLNYSPGDEIYLFGFSRGAYTVRSLAGLMYNSGLLPRHKIRKIPRAYELYRNSLKPDNPKIANFRKEHGVKTEKYGYRVPITLLACWDTVGALGIPDLTPIINLAGKINKKYLFHDCKLSPITQNALHAVAIDEQRSTFDASLMEKSNKTEDQRLIQKWFPGDHGCVGGGSKEQRGLSDGALKWMIDSIDELELGLEIDTSVITSSEDDADYAICPKADAEYKVEPKSIIGKITRIMGKTVRTVSDDFEDLHESVHIRWNALGNYRPDNLEKHSSKLNEA